MPSGQVIINAALTRLGILEQGGTPSSSDSQDALDNLNAMWDAWSIDEGLIYAEKTQQFALTATVGTYPIGPSAASPFNVPLPTRIYKAFFVTSTGRNEIEIVNSEKYHSHNDLAASAVAPDELFPDFNTDPTSGSASLSLWPVVSGSGTTLELLTGTVFASWTLATNYKLSPGLQDALEWSLAYRLLSSFGAAVDPAVAQNIAQIGSKAEARIRVMNAKNRLMPLPEDTSPEIQLTAALPPKQA